MTCFQSIISIFAFIGNFLKGSLIALWYLIVAIVLWFIPKCLRFKDISNELALVTGGASGLGRLFAIKLAKRGANVIIWDLNLAGLEETAKMIEELRSKKESVGKCYVYQVDISNRVAVYATAERIKQEIGTVTMLINNAGVVTGKRLLECKDEQIVKTFDVNVLAHFWILKSFLPGMMEKNHGHVASVASIAGLVGAYQLTDYCASKFAAVGLEESLRLELNCDGYDGIHSTVICPYYINTGMFAGVGRSLIPILTPEYVVDEAVKAILVNQEMVCLPTLVYWMVMMKTVVPTKTFLWLHRAIGAASTMKTFKGRRGPNAPLERLLSNEAKNKNNDLTIRMEPPHDIGITIPQDPDQPNKLQLTQ